MALYNAYGSTSMTLNIVLLIITGAFVNGPYALITTAVSADLGTHEGEIYYSKIYINIIQKTLINNKK